MTDNREKAAETQAVIFIHGFLDAAPVWDGVIAGIDDASLKLIKVDLPGMGALAADHGRTTLEDYAAIVADAIEKAGLPAILVGQSMGAQIAELAAIGHPDRVVGLVLVTPVPLGGARAPSETVAPFKSLGGDPEAQRQVRQSLSPGLSADQLDQLAGYGAAVSPAVVEHLVDLWNDGVPAGAEASSFIGPVIVMRGAEDGFVTEETATAIASRFETVTLETQAGAGHWLHVEQPKAVSEAVVGMATALRGGGDWQQAFAKRSAGAFAQAFAEDVQLEASVMFAPVIGRENVKHVMEAASKIYESLEFVAQTSHENAQYLQWNAKAFGGVEIEGVTVITRNGENAIQRVAIHHRPLAAAMLFSVTIGEALRGMIDPAHFLAAADLPPQLRRA